VEDKPDIEGCPPKFRDPMNKRFRHRSATDERDIIIQALGALKGEVEIPAAPAFFSGTDRNGPDNVHLAGWPEAFPGLMESRKLPDLEEPRREVSDQKNFPARKPGEERSIDEHLVGKMDLDGRRKRQWTIQHCEERRRLDHLGIPVLQDPDKRTLSNRGDHMLPDPQGIGRVSGAREHR